MLATSVLLAILAGLVLTPCWPSQLGSACDNFRRPGTRARAMHDPPTTRWPHVEPEPSGSSSSLAAVAWTAFPAVVGAVASTLTIPLSIAGLGIIARGIAYALQSATDTPHERRVIDTVFALSSILTPYMLGSALGAIASGRVPIGNAAPGDLVTSWLNPTSSLCGARAGGRGRSIPRRPSTWPPTPAASVPASCNAPSEPAHWPPESRPAPWLSPV